MCREIVSTGSLAKIVAEWPVPGFYAVRLVKDGPLLPLRIYIEREFDEAGDQMADDVVKCLVDGREADWRRHWPYCASKPITAQQYERMRKDQHVATPLSQRAPIF